MLSRPPLGVASSARLACQPSGLPGSCHQDLCLIPGFAATSGRPSRGDPPLDGIESIQGRRFTLDAIFADGFETGDLSAWE